MEPNIIIFLAGLCGGLIKEIFDDNTITLPKRISGELVLGSIGSLLIGGVAGYLIDGNLITAFLAGYAGKSIIESLAVSKNSQNKSNQTDIQEIIKAVAKIECVDPELCIRVAKCESSLNPNAKNINTGGSTDRGLFQINDKYHPEVSDAQAYDPMFATQFFCRAFKNKNLSWWSASKSCWDIDKLLG
jgi:hypothetical protein